MPDLSRSFSTVGSTPTTLSSHPFSVAYGAGSALHCSGHLVAAQALIHESSFIEGYACGASLRITNEGLKSENTFSGAKADLDIVIELVDIGGQPIIVFRSGGVASRESCRDDTLTSNTDVFNMFRCFVGRTRI